ncbi:MAG: glycoside hydrolase family 2 TIM barrel-domain containing protein [Rikenellaceae bacterium]
MRLFSSLFLILLSLNSFAQDISFKEWQQEGATSKGLEQSRSICRSFDNRDEALANGEGRFYIPLSKGWSVFQKAKNVDGSIVSNTFFIPKTWVGRDIFLHVGKGEQSYYISVNGNVVGYVENGKDIAQFNVERSLHLDGDNTIDILYINASKGSLLEAKSKGNSLNNDIYLFAQPKVHIQDFFIDASLSEDLSSGLLEIDIAVKNGYNVTSQTNVGYDIVNSEGEIITYNNRDMIIDAMSVDTLHLSRIVKDVHSWSSEHPYLYTIIFRVKHEGRMVEYIPFKIGFRNVSIKDNVITINGTKSFLKGHVTPNPDILTKERVKALKAKGVNAISYSAQPKSNNIYTLCDAMGLMLIEEANISSPTGTTERKIGGTTANAPQYNKAYIERIQRRYLQTRNYPSIIIWSLGDNVGNGFNMYRAYLKMKELDPYRAILNKGGNGEWNSDMTTEKRDHDVRPVISFSKKEKGTIGQFLENTY